MLSPIPTPDVVHSPYGDPWWVVPVYNFILFECWQVLWLASSQQNLAKMVGYINSIRLHLSRLERESPAGPEEGSCHSVRKPRGRDYRGWGAQCNPWMAVSKNTGTSVLQPQELNSARNHVSMEEEPKLLTGMLPSSHLAVLRDPEEITLLHWSQNSDPWKPWDNKYILGSQVYGNVLCSNS